MRPPGWYMIQPRGFGPNGESVTSPSACSTFHDTSFQVPMNCALTERDERQFGEKYSRMRSRRRTLALRSEVEDDASFQSLSDWGGNVRFGSKADICAAPDHVRFTPNSDRESGHPQKVMSAFPPKADMCGARADVRYGPIAYARRNRVARPTLLWAFPEMARKPVRLLCTNRPFC